MHYTIYETTNLVNGKKYIGKHITENLDDGYLGSGLYLKKSIKKYGKENFVKKTLFVFDNEETMNLKERELVNESVINNPNYYNISLGGQGGVTVLFENHPLYKEVCSKISEAQKSRSERMSEITKDLHKDKKVGMYGKKQSDLQKQTVSKRLKGVKKSPESVKKQNESLLKTIKADGYVHPNTGRKATDETLKRMSTATKNRPKRICGHCDKILDPANYAKYHGEKCALAT
jgi:hypothetical protein